MRVVVVIFLILIGLAAVVGLNSVFTVTQRQQALVLQLGAPVAIYNEWGADEEPGLKFKLPFIQDVVLLDRRNLVLDSEPQLITAGDQQRLNVDSFARWRISDPLLFYQRLNNVAQAQARLEEVLNTAVREVLGTVNSPEIISGQRAALMQRIQERMSEQVSRSGNEFGVEVIDVKIRRVELPPENRERVFARMIAERNQEAQGIRGEGDSQRNGIYAAAYGQDEEFFAFYRSMLAYEAAIDEGTTMLLAPDSDFFDYFTSERGAAGDR